MCLLMDQDTSTVKASDQTCFRDAYFNDHKSSICGITGHMVVTTPISLDNQSVLLLQRGGRISTISQVTAAQIHSAVEGGEGHFKIDDREVGMVSLDNC